MEESNANGSYIVHDCGCNLQVHKRCLIKWLFTLNKKRLDGYDINDFYKINTVRELKRRICYLVDGNRILHEDMNTVETIQSLPVVGQTWASFICVTDLAIRAILGLSTPKYRSHELWRGVPIESVECPQCKKKVLARPLQYTSGSPVLFLLRLTKQVNRYAAVIFLCVASSTNIVKWWLKCALWQLRCIMPESVLRKALKVTTTRALDVYFNSMTGFRSIDQHTKLLVLGFPIYLASLRFSKSLFAHLRFLYPFLLVKHQLTNGLLAKVSSYTELLVLFYPLLFDTLSNSIVNRWLAKSQPYFLEPKWNAAVHDYSFEYADEADQADLVIKSTWCDIFIENLIWPWLGKQISSKILSRIGWIANCLTSICPEATPDECEYAMNVFGCVAVVLGKDLIRLYLTFRRLKELEAFQDFISDT